MTTITPDEFLGPAELSPEEFLGGSERISPRATVGGAYEGASRYDREVALWNPPLQSADVDMFPAKYLGDSRVRDQLRNDAFAAGGRELVMDSIVGGLFLLNAKPAYNVLGLDATWAEEFQQEVEEKFTLGVESPKAWIDASRRLTLTEMVRLAIGIRVAAGEILASCEWITNAKRPFSTAIQLIDLDRLSNPNGQMDQQYLRRGVRLGRYGEPIGYYIRTVHPRDIPSITDVWKWQYVRAEQPWGRPNIIHLIDQQRPAQTRGLSALVAALQEMHITKKFRKITLQNAVIGATYAATIESELPTEQVFTQLDGGNMTAAALRNGIVDYGTAYLSAIADYVGSSRNTHIDGVKIPHLFPGTKLQIRNAGTPGGVGTDFEKALLRYIAAALGVSYEQLSKDYSATNYSSARAAMVETWKSMSSIKRRVADRFASTVYRLWLEEMLDAGEIESMPRNAPSFYDPLMQEAYCACDWIGSARGQIDELKETQAAVLRLDRNLSTREIEIARIHGKDWRAVFAQLERENIEMRARGIEPIANPTQNAITGEPRQEGADE